MKPAFSYALMAVSLLVMTRRPDTGVTGADQRAVDFSDDQIDAWCMEHEGKIEVEN